MPTEAQIKKLADKKPHERTDEEYDAIWDAQTLARAEEIKTDTERFNKAVLWANVLLIEEKEETEALRKVANAENS